MNNNKFEEWLKSQQYKLFGDQEYFAKLAWDACKNEIINHIKKDGHRMVNSYTIAEEIEKL